MPFASRTLQVLKDKLKSEPKATFYVLGAAAPVFALMVYASVALPPAPIPPPETPAQANARLAAAQLQATVTRQAAERTKMLCALRATCSRYGEVRQQCAAAGDFKNCIRVKMGAGDFDQTDSCTEDGNIAIAPESEIPDRVSCFLTP
jgi:hypothetical protein